MDMQTALKAVRRPVSYAAEQLVAAQFRHGRRGGRGM